MALSLPVCSGSRRDRRRLRSSRPGGRSHRQPASRYPHHRGCWGRPGRATYNGGLQIDTSCGSHGDCGTTVSNSDTSTTCSMRFAFRRRRQFLALSYMHSRAQPQHSRAPRPVMSPKFSRKRASEPLAFKWSKKYMRKWHRRRRCRKRGDHGASSRCPHESEWHRRRLGHSDQHARVGLVPLHPCRL